MRQSGSYYTSTLYVNASTPLKRTGPLLSDQVRQWGFDCGENVASEIEQKQEFDIKVHSTDL